MLFLFTVLLVGYVPMTYGMESTTAPSTPHAQTLELLSTIPNRVLPPLDAYEIPPQCESYSIPNIQFSPGNTYLIGFNKKEHQAYMWDTRTAQRIKHFKKCAYLPVLSPDDSHIAFIDSENPQKLFIGTVHEELSSLLLPENGEGLAWSPDNATIAVQTENNILLYDEYTKNTIQSFSAPPSQEQTMMFFGGDNPTLVRLLHRQGNPLKFHFWHLKGHPEVFLPCPNPSTLAGPIRFSPNGVLLIPQQKDENAVAIGGWNLEGHNIFRYLFVTKLPFRELKWSATQDYYGLIVFDLERGAPSDDNSELCIMQADKKVCTLGQADQFFFLPGTSNRCIVHDFEGNIQVYSPQGRLLRELKGSAFRPRAYSSDGLFYVLNQAQGNNLELHGPIPNTKKLQKTWGKISAQDATLVASIVHRKEHGSSQVLAEDTLQGVQKLPRVLQKALVTYMHNKDVD